MFVEIVKVSSSVPTLLVKVSFSCLELHVYRIEESVRGSVSFRSVPQFFNLSSCKDAVTKLSLDTTDIRPPILISFGFFFLVFFKKSRCAFFLATD